MITWSLTLILAEHTVKQPKIEQDEAEAENEQLNETKSDNDVEEIRPSSTEGENRPHIPHSIPSMMSNPFFPRLNPALLNGLNSAASGAPLPPVSSASGLVPALPPTHPLMAHLHRMNNQRMMADPRVPSMPLGLPRFDALRPFPHQGTKLLTIDHIKYNQ